MSKKDVMSHGMANELVTKLEGAGLTGDMAQAVIQSRDNQLAKDWVDHLSAILGGQSTWGDAIETFGAKAIPITIAISLHIGVRGHLYDQIPIPRALMASYHHRGLFLAALPAVSLINLQAVAPQYFRYDWEAFREAPFARVVSRAGYHLMFPGYPSSGDMTFDDQLAFRPRDMEAPYAVEVAYLALAWYRLNGEILLTGWVRCSDPGPWGHHVAVTQSVDGKVVFGYALDRIRAPDEKIGCSRYLNG